MSRLSNAANGVGSNQFHSHQADVISAVVNKILGCLLFRFRRQLVIIHLPLMLPMHAEDIALPHTLLISKRINSLSPMVGTIRRHLVFVDNVLALRGGIEGKHLKKNVSTGAVETTDDTDCTDKKHLRSSAVYNRGFTKKFNRR